jgi:benzoyl-CoA-dihydrodiol lyase
VIVIDFQTHPDRYRHWRLAVDGRIATLDMDVDPDGGLHGDYKLKLNSYDLGVDIELADAIQRLRFEHPEVGAVVLGSMKERVFCAGANISMLAGAPHPLKVNFCKFTNETRNGIEEATSESGQRYLAAINGTAAGGGYELALATDHIMLIDDGSASVALPEVPLLAVLPGTGGLTRLVDKRFVRRDRADVFCTIEEGIKGSRAVEWKLVDELVPGSTFVERVADRATEFANASPRPVEAPGVTLTSLDRMFGDNGVEYSSVAVTIDRDARTAEILIKGPADAPPADPEGAESAGADWWVLRLARELDDAILHLRVNELEIGTWIIRTEGDLDAVLDHDRFLHEHADHWFVNEVLLFWRRILKRVDVTSRTIVTLIEPGSCFGGMLADLGLASDRTYMFLGVTEDDDRLAELAFTESSRGVFPMSNGLNRLATRFWGDDVGLEGAESMIGARLDADAAMEAGLVTEIYDDIDWDDELRIILEERKSFSPDCLTAMEANLRFPGPETLETKIFGRLTAWQNWVFQRPSASGEKGALRRYGTGLRPEYDKRRV